jgi:hypothetical protein
MQISLKKFDPSTIEDTRIVTIIAKRGTGKSFLVRDLLYHKRHISKGIAVSATEESNSFYGEFIPDLFIYNEFKLEILERLMDRQKILKKKGHKNEKAFLVLDDCMYNKAQWKQKKVVELFYNGRHYNIFTVLTNQWAYDLLPNLRSNIDIIFIGKDVVRQNRERLWKSFGGIFPTFNEFCVTLDTVTENYGWLVIDQTKNSNNLEDCAFWYRARERKFKMGGSEMWRFHQLKYDKDYDDPTKKKERTKPPSKVAMVK